MKNIVITGIGTYSSIGRNVKESLESLLTEKHGIQAIKHLDTVYKDEIPAAEIQETNHEIIQILGLQDSYGITRATLIGMVAAREAFEDADLQRGRGTRTGIVSANTVGGMDESEKVYLENIAQHPAHTEYVLSHDSGAGTEHIADFLDIKDYVSTISTACSSAANAIMLGARLIKSGRLNRVLVGGTDCLTKFTLNGFKTLGILDAQACRPMDDKRQGLNLGEGAGYLVLEREELAKDKKIYGRLSGYCNTNDAYHQTASSPEGKGAFDAMNKALKMSELIPAQIDYINLHGTGTVNNDLSEGRAIQRLFGENPPMLSSTKSFTGHTLGAAGGLEAVYSILALEHGVVFPSLRFSTPIQDLNLIPVKKALKNKPIQHVLSNSFGFGGNNSTLIFSKK